MSVVAPSLTVSGTSRDNSTPGRLFCGEIPVTVLDFASPDTSVVPFHRSGITAVRLHDSLWRVTRAGGEVVGYVERFAEERGTRFRAKRLVVRQQRFVPIGEFWSMDDAVESLRAN